MDRHAPFSRPLYSSGILTVKYGVFYLGLTKATIRTLQRVIEVVPLTFFSA
jgi:hypothetical protein